MGSKRAEKPPSSKSKPSLKPLPPKKSKKKTTKSIHSKSVTTTDSNHIEDVQPVSAQQHLTFFLDQFQSANEIQLSSLELESIKDTSVVEPGEETGDDVKTIGKRLKKAFGETWKEELCEGQLVEGKMNAGCPAVLIISASALRSLELLKGVRSLTRECRAVKLFSKHMKVEEQEFGNDAIHKRIGKGIHDADFLYLHVSLLKNRVNIASGTPSRIKKLIDIEALGLSRLQVIVLDIHTDVKGYSLFTLPQVRDEFWDLYKDCFHQRLVQGDLQICLFGPIPNVSAFMGKKKKS